MRPFRTAPFLAFVFLMLLAAPVRAEEEEPKPDAPPKEEAGKGEASKGEAGKGDAERNPLKVLDDKAAKDLLKELKKAAKKRDAKDIMPTLDKIETVAHEDFDKPLLRLLKHDSGRVATRVAGMWEWRVRDKKVASRLWKATWAEKSNRRRFIVKAVALKAFARANIPLDDRQFKEIERDWRWIVGNPDERHAEALAAIAGWVVVSKDKRLFRRLADELDEPGTDSPNSPSNPPASWWEKRWKMWKAAKPAVVEALHAITGQEFDKSSEAKAWCEQHGKKAGVAW